MSGAAAVPGRSARRRRDGLFLARCAHDGGRASRGAAIRGCGAAGTGWPRTSGARPAG